MASVRHRPLLILITLFAIPTFLSSQSIIQMPTKRHHVASSSDSLFYDSWRFSVETNDARTWSNILSRCVGFVQNYMTSDWYLSDYAAIANFSLSFSKGVTTMGMTRGLSTSVRLFFRISPTMRHMDSDHRARTRTPPPLKLQAFLFPQLAINRFKNYLQL